LIRSIAATPSSAAEPRSGRPRVIWRFSDGRAGHDSQSLALVEALARRLPLDVHTVSVPVWAESVGDLIGRRCSAGKRLPDPWLLVGAGRRTHLPLLAARRARHGRAVVIMRPGVPCFLYDLCIIPDHDRPAAAPNVIVSRGSLNRARRLPGRPRTQGMILVGGPSRHHRWKNDAVAAQIARVVQSSPPDEWVLATSRRTPEGFLERLGRALGQPRVPLTILRWQGEDGGPSAVEQLERSHCVWVTEDSVSMVYEALTAGVATGLLEVPARGRARVIDAMRQLARTGQVTRFGDWRAGQPLQAPADRFDEANRCAEWICARWGPESSPD
jgi:mitochondrial fission protein ELM1